MTPCIGNMTPHYVPQGMQNQNTQVSIFSFLLKAGPPVGQAPTNLPPGKMMTDNLKMFYLKFPGCPQGLQYLTMVDQLLIKQKVEVLEVVTGIETANQYEVLNSLGQQVGQ